MSKSKVYAVRKGRQTGLFYTWADCEAQVSGYPGSEYKSFKTEDEANVYLGLSNTVDVQTPKPRRLPKYTPLPFDAVPFAFIDGSFNPDTNVYGYGGFLCVGDAVYQLQGSGDNPMYTGHRNVAGEILGAKAAVSAAQELKLKELIIHYDYEGLDKWVSGDWKTNTVMTMEYAAFMNKAISSGLNIMFKKEDAHTIDKDSLTWGKVNNERADILAKRAVGLRDLADAAERRLNRLLDANDMTIESLSPSAFDAVYDSPF